MKSTSPPASFIQPPPAKRLRATPPPGKPPSHPQPIPPPPPPSSSPAAVTPTVEVIDLDGDEEPRVSAPAPVPESTSRLNQNDEVVLIDDEADVIDLDSDDITDMYLLPEPMSTDVPGGAISTNGQNPVPPAVPSRLRYPPMGPDFLTRAQPPSSFPPPSSTGAQQQKPRRPHEQSGQVIPSMTTVQSRSLHTAPNLQQQSALSTDDPNRLHVSQGGGLFRVQSDTIEIIDDDDEEKLAQGNNIVSTTNGLYVLPTSQPSNSNRGSLVLPPIDQAPNFVSQPGIMPPGSMAPGHNAPFLLPPFSSLHNLQQSSVARYPSIQGSHMSQSLPFPTPTSGNRPPIYSQSPMPPPRAVQQQPPPNIPPPTVPQTTANVQKPPVNSRVGLTEEGFRALVKQNHITAEADKEAETPSEMMIELMPHQKRALEWMTKRERPMDLDEEVVAADDECLGGILADEQGLGKTLTMIAVMLKNRPRESSNAGGTYGQDTSCDSDSGFESDSDSNAEEGASGETGEKHPWRTLVVCPLSLMHQWRGEILSNIRKADKPRVRIYHGPKRDRSVRHLKRCDVVITTYATLQSEYPKVLKDHPENRLRKAENLKLLRRTEGPLFNVHWRRVVLDEAHTVKNRETESWSAVMSLRASVRWCLTGTPITNSVDDIYSLFCFVRYKFVPSHELWNRHWKKKLEHPLDAVRRPAFKRFQTICGVVVLRRTKQDEINGKPLLSLPKKLINVVDCTFTDIEEQAVYQAVQEKSILTVNKYLMGGRARLNYSSMLVLLLRLRQACCHPFLVQYSRMQGQCQQEMDERYATPYSKEKLEEAMELLEGQQSLLEMLEDAVRERVEKSLQPPEKKAGAVDWGPFKCLGCHVEKRWEHGIVFGCGDLFCEGCADMSRAQGRCLLCASTVGNGGCAELNANELRMEVHAKLIMGSGELSGLSVTGREIKGWLEEELKRQKRERTLVQARSGGSTSDNGLSGTVASKDVDDDDLVLMDLHIENARKRAEAIANSSKGAKNDSSLLEKRKRKLLNAFSQHSTKIRMVLDELERVRKEGHGEKTLIFSQWTTMLDMLEFHVELNGHSTCRLDGSMTIAVREEQIAEFKRSKTKNVLLISLHSGGTGLNLTVACRVILTDVWWNPCVEEQAIDRVHRIGQSKTVHVTRFKMKGTVEERIYTICAAKRAKVAGALGESSSRSLGRRKLTMNELMSLFSSAAEEVGNRAEPGSAAATAAENVANFASQPH